MKVIGFCQRRFVNDMKRKEQAKSRANSKRRTRILKRMFTIFGSIFIIGLVSIITYAWYLHDKVEDAVAEAQDEVTVREKSDLRIEKVDPNLDNVSILLMGIDSSDKRGSDDNARSDALMVATLNTDEKSIKLLSIPRDSLVYIPKIGYQDKINHAHAFGGPYATIETIEHLLGIPIDYYIRINFEAFIEVVEALDGININVPYEFKEQDSRDKADAIHLYPGYQTLNGEEALALARTRKLDSDYERGKRQQEIIKAIVNRAFSISSLFKYDEVIDAIGGNLRTNMTFSDM